MPFYLRTMKTVKHKIISAKNTFAVIFVFTIMVFVGVLGTLIVSSVQDVFAAINKQINYQGKLTNNAGAAVADGAYNMEFKLYTVSSGGSPLWTETRTSGDQVQVTNGLFSVLLGEVTSLSGVDFNQTLYLGVNIGGTSTPVWDGEMTPRKKLGVVPAAIVAETLEGLYASQFFRNDITNATSSAQAFLRVQQSGTGAIAEFIGSASTTVFTIASDGNVGIGTTTPAARLQVAGLTEQFRVGYDASTYYTTTVGATGGVTFDAVGTGAGFTFSDSVNVNNALTVTGVANFANGSSTAPSITFASDIDTGIYRGGANNLRMVTGGADRLTIDASGNVGIGTTSPSARLHIAGASQRIFIGNPVNTDSFDLLYSAGAYPGFRQEVQRPSGGAAFNLFTLYASKTGAVGNSLWGGIGVRGTFGTLGVNETPSVDYMYFGTETTFGFSNHTFRLYSNKNAYFDGNVGIGNTSPSSKLSINVTSGGQLGTSTPNGIVINDTSAGSSWDTVNPFAVLDFSTFDTSSGAGAGARGRIGLVMTNLTGSRSRLGFFTESGTAGTFAERMTILGNETGAAGNVGIGTTTPAARLHVEGLTQQLRIGYDASDYLSTTVSSDGTVGFTAVGTAPKFNFMGGNVGIGTTTPTGTLHIFSASAGTYTPNAAADDLIIENNGSGGITLVTPDASTSNINFGSPSRQAGGQISWNQSSALFTIGANNAGGQVRILSNNAVEAMRITSEGNVGIGTTSPITTLHVRGVGGTNPFRISSSTNVSLFEVLQNGNVGIGTSTPSSPLAINLAAEAYTGTGLYVFGSGSESPKLTLQNTGTGGRTYKILSTNNSSAFGAGALVFADAASGARMVIGSTGLVGIGTTTPSHTLTVAGDINLTGALRRDGNGGVSGMVLQSTGTGVQWVATSSLGIIGGGSSDGVFTIGTGVIFNATSSDKMGIGTTSPLATLDVYGDVLVSGANRYLNFGTTTGSEGYGIRDNNGAVEFKNLAGNWQTVSSFTSTSSPNGANGTLQFNDAGSFSGDESLVWDNTNNRLGIGTSSPAEALHVAGNILVGKRTDATGVWTLRTPSTPGKFDLAGTESISAITAMAVYNGSLYAGTRQAGSAEVYRYNGGTSWTKVSNPLPGTIAEDAGATSAIDAVSSMAVYNGMLYIGTAKTGGAEVYQYNGNSTWTLISSSTAGVIGGNATTTAIDSISAMTVHNGQLIIGTSKSAQAELYRYDIGQNINAQQRWFKLTSANAGTIGSQTAVNGVTALLSHNGYLYLGLSKLNAITILRMDAPMPTNTFTTINPSPGNFGTIAANQDNIRTLAIFNGSLFVGVDDGAGVNVARVVRWNGNYTAGTTWGLVSSTSAGVIAEDAGSQSGIDRIMSMTVYKNDLYIGTADSTGIGQVYKYDGGTTWTLVSSSTAGVIPTTGTGHNSGISGVTAMAVYNDDLWIGTEEAASAEVYSYNLVEGESNKILFEADSDNAESVQNNLRNYGAIQFQGEESGRNVTGNMNTGVFVFSHGINTVVGAYDLAEDYPTRDDTLTPGDLVSLDTREKGFVRKAQGRNDRDIIGIYSVDPALRLSQKDSHIDGARAVPIALAGRVPVTVTLENGPIKIGDYLTSSMEPGKAAKANKPGRVIGRALGNYSGLEGEEPKVTVFLGLESIDWNDIQVAQVEIEELNEESVAGDKNAIVEFVDTVNEAAEGLVFALLNRADNVAVVITNQFTALFASIQELFVRTLAILPGGSFTVPSGENQISGTAIMPAGATDVLIPNEQVDEQSIIYVSPTSAIDAPMFIGKKVAGKGFHVRLKEPFNEDITFDWFFIKTYIPKNKNGNEVNTIVEQEDGEGTQNGTTTITIVSPDAAGVSSQADTVPVDDVSSSDSNIEDGVITSEGQATSSEDLEDANNIESGDSGSQTDSVSKSISEPTSAPEPILEPVSEPIIEKVVESAPIPPPEPVPLSAPTE